MNDVKAEELFREAQAPWQEDGLGVRGRAVDHLGATDLPTDEFRAPYLNPDRITVRPPVPAPVLPSLPVTSPTIPTVDVNTYAFKMVDATGDPKSPIKSGRAILIYDGQVSDSSGNSQFPSGMGNDNFYLQIGGDGYQVWCEITYDPTTLAITSASIAQGPAIPTSTLGDSYILLGTVTLDPDGTLTPHNTQCGDINLAFIYGAFNGAAALYLLSQLDVPQPLPTS